MASRRVSPNVRGGSEPGIVNAVIVFRRYTSIGALTRSLPRRAFQISATRGTSVQRWLARLSAAWRGYALRWVVSRGIAAQQGPINAEYDDRDLVRAYEAIQRSIDESSGHGLERQRVASLFEAARLNILALYGAPIGRGREALEMSPLSFAAGLHYLDMAFVELGSPGSAMPEWLEILGSRLVAYFRIVTGDRKPEAAELRDERMKHFFQIPLGHLIEYVTDEYRQFATELTDPHACDVRIERFRENVDQTINGIAQRT